MASDGSFWNYNEEGMQNAAKEVQKGTPLATAAKNHQVPRTTLRNYLLKGPDHFKKMGRKPVLQKSEEDILVLWIQTCARAGFPVTSEDLLSSVQKLLKDLHRENEFENDRPGRSWLAGFKKRNPSISTRMAQNLTVTRASVTDVQLRRWFDEVLNYLKESRLEYVLKEPNRIFNADESAFFLNPKGSKVLAPKGSKNVYQQVNSNEKECITVLICASADGLLGPPLVIFKYERIPKDLVDSVPKGWGLGKSKSGWMTCELFYEYITNVYYPWLVKNEIPRPVLLFVDGHTSHLSLHTSQFCNENGIVLVALFPNATHLIQPMDVAVFHTLKESWKSKVHEWRQGNRDNPTIKKKDFCPLMKQVLDEKVSPLIIRNGFRKCGLYPWNSAAPEIPIQQEVQPTSDKKYNVKELKQAINILEHYVGSEKIAKFKSSSTYWTGSERDQELFLVWQKMSQDVSHQEPFTVFNSPEELSEPAYIQTSNNSEQDSVEQPDTISQHHQLGSSENRIISHTPPPENMVSSLPGPSVDRDLGDSETQKTVSIISSPFKRSLFWPQQRTQAKQGRKKKELVPSVVTSDKWRELQINKANKKEETEKLKEQRKRERLTKKEERDALKKQKANEREIKNKLIKKKIAQRKKRSQLFSSDEEDS